MRVPGRVIGSISRRLQSSLSVYEEHLTDAHRELFGPLVLAVLKSTSCYVSAAARELADLGGTITAREDKLLKFIHSPKLRLGRLKRAHLERLRPDFKRAERVRIYADLSDISKRYARKMDALDIVRDASDPDKRKRPGYWLNEVYVSTSEKSLVPVVMEPFSTKEEGFRSQNALILDAMEAVYGATDGRGTWISDCGYDDRKVFSPAPGPKASVHHKAQALREDLPAPCRRGGEAPPRGNDRQEHGSDTPHLGVSRIRTSNRPVRLVPRLPPRTVRAVDARGVLGPATGAPRAPDG